MQRRQLRGLPRSISRGRGEIKLNSIFYHGFAIHGTNDLRRLGGPASHGCVRLHPSNAATLYALVERNGRGSTRIEIY